MSLPTPKPPTADGNPPEYNAMMDLAERCAASEKLISLASAKILEWISKEQVQRERAMKSEAELVRVQKQSAAMRGAIKQAHEALTEFASLYEDHRTTATIELLSKLFQPNSGHNDTFTNGGNDACDPEYKPKILRSARSNSVSPPNKQQK